MEVEERGARVGGWGLGVGGRGLRVEVEGRVDLHRQELLELRVGGIGVLHGEHLVSGFGVSGLGFRVSGFGFRVSGSGFRFSGLGRRV